MEAIFVVDGEELILFSKKLMIDVFSVLIDGSKMKLRPYRRPDASDNKKFIQTILHTLSSYEQRQVRIYSVYSIVNEHPFSDFDDV